MTYECVPNFVFGSVRFAEVFTNILENVHERLIFRTHVGDYNINVKKLLFYNNV